ncbi:hypothetical protein Tco_1198390 [Tanacetum coccineum]
MNTSSSIGVPTESDNTMNEDTSVGVAFPESFPTLTTPVITMAGNALGVPVTAFSEDGLSVIPTKLGTPLILDSYTSDMCMQSWGRSSYARVMIEL